MQFNYQLHELNPNSFFTLIPMGWGEQEKNSTHHFDMTKHHLYILSSYRNVPDFFFILTANISFRPSSTYMGSTFNRQVQNDL